MLYFPTSLSDETKNLEFASFHFIAAFWFVKKQNEFKTPPGHNLATLNSQSDLEMT